MSAPAGTAALHAARHHTSLTINVNHHLAVWVDVPSYYQIQVIVVVDFAHHSRDAVIAMVICAGQFTAHCSSVVVIRRRASHVA